MSWSTTNLTRQPNGTESVNDNGIISAQIAFKGLLSACKTAANGLKVGDTIDGNLVAKTWNIRETSGGYAVITINCADREQTETEGEKTATLLKDQWSVKSVRNDVSIFAYCGTSSIDTASGDANRADLEMWMAEKDPTNYNDHRFKDDQGNLHELNAAGKAIAGKIQKGITSVIRFYPQITRKRTYNAFPPGLMEDIGFINDPPVTGSKMSGFTGNYQWLKIQDDADENTDSSYTRTESWIGILKSDAYDGASPWDADLYGASRWKMPYKATS